MKRLDKQLIKDCFSCIEEDLQKLMKTRGKNHQREELIDSIEDDLLHLLFLLDREIKRGESSL